MPTTDIPAEAVEAAATDMYEHSTLGMDMCRLLSRDVLRVALPHLAPCFEPEASALAAVEAKRDPSGPTLTVLRGLPGSGKSTLARQLRDKAREQSGRPGTLVVVGRDDIRQHLIGLTMDQDDQVLDREGEDLVTAIEAAIVDACLTAGVDVVVDATHLHRSHLERWDDVAAMHGAQLDVRDLDVPVEECIRRDADRRNTGGRYVGEDVIRRMHAAGAPTYETGELS